MNGYAILYIGMTGSGKSTMVKHLVRNVHESRLLVYDVQREYFDDDVLPEIEDFQNDVHKLRGGHAVFEEATIFFSNRGRDANMIKILVDKRHHRNVIHLCFHSITDVPGNIFRLVNYAFVFQTNDNGETVLKRYPQLYRAWRIVNHKRESAQKLVLPNGNYLPFEIVKIIEPAKSYEQ